MRLRQLWPTLLLPALVGCSGTQNYIREKQMEAQVRQYGQAVLDAYKQQALAAPVEPTASFDLPCAKAYAQSLPAGVGGCEIIVWGPQALVELLHSPTKDNGNISKLTRVGQFDPATMASEGEIKAFGRAVAEEYKAWVKTPAAEAWFKARREEYAVIGWGSVLECHTFSERPLPKGVKSCIEGPGATDGPTIILYTFDGRWFEFAAWN